MAKAPTRDARPAPARPPARAADSPMRPARLSHFAALARAERLDLEAEVARRFGCPPYEMSSATATQLLANL